ncbi:hypothetical protein Gotri_013080, partial [Gossypium trilobum]|nr:hypothetical protein [Gossypium trilobum]
MLRIECRTNVMDAVRNLSTAKKAEIQYLRNLLERVGNELNSVFLGFTDLISSLAEIR